MTRCTLCQHFSDTKLDDKRGVWRCASESVSEVTFEDQLMDDPKTDCPEWYPSEKQGLYTFSEGEWEHRCEKTPTDSVVYWEEVAMCWCVDGDTVSEMRVLFCPWCGIELQPMPEEKD